MKAFPSCPFVSFVVEAFRGGSTGNEKKNEHNGSRFGRIR